MVFSGKNVDGLASALLCLKWNCHLSEHALTRLYTSMMEVRIGEGDDGRWDWYFVCNWFFVDKLHTVEYDEFNLHMNSSKYSIHFTRYMNMCIYTQRLCLKHIFDCCKGYCKRTNDTTEDIFPFLLCSLVISQTLRGSPVMFVQAKL